MSQHRDHHHRASPERLALKRARAAARAAARARAILRDRAEQLDALDALAAWIDETEHRSRLVRT